MNDQMNQLDEQKTPEQLHEMWETLDKQYPVFKEYMAQRDQLAAYMIQRLGIGHHWQDEEGTVYQVGTWKGTFISPKEAQVDRTRREGEKQGGLSLTSARELGYIVEGQAAKPSKEHYPRVVPESEFMGHPEGK